MGRITADAQSVDTGMDFKMNLADRYLAAYQIAYNPGRALELYTECAINGNARAMNAVGVQYRLGLGADTNFTTALQWFQKSAAAGYARAWFNLGLMYKYGSGVARDYKMAFNCFATSAAMGEPSGYYGEGYMLYKGLGCAQDYPGAFAAFQAGAAGGKASCMYFLGLCYRNGYGVAVNTDSARYWLSKASAMGYRFAGDEMHMPAPENITAAGKLIRQAGNAKSISAMANDPVNQYTRLPYGGINGQLSGRYEGYLLKYDYSGKTVIEASNLKLDLDCDSGSVRGQWDEADSLSISLQGGLADSNIVFNGMQYRKTDHYHSSIPLTYDFQNATLHVARDSGNVFLTGELRLYTVEKKEPERPVTIVLQRTRAADDKPAGEMSSSGQETASSFTVFPNPFSTVCNVQFNLPQTSNVYAEVLTADGKSLLVVPVANLSGGSYLLPVSFRGTAGIYMLRVVIGTKSYVRAIIKTTSN